MNLINEREQELDMLQQQEEATSSNTKTEEDTSEQPQEDQNNVDDDGIQLPTTGDKMKDKLNELPEADFSMLGTEETNPALRGDVALVIFDVAMKSLGDSFIKKHQGYYTVTDSQVDKELSSNTLAYLFDRCMDFITLFTEFKDLKRDYLTNHVLQWLKNDHYNVSLENDLPQKYVELLLYDVTLNIRYMTLVDLDIDNLQLSFKKFTAYKNKLDQDIGQQLTIAYSNYLTQYLLSNLKKEDAKYDILSAIIKRL